MAHGQTYRKGIIMAGGAGTRLHPDVAAISSKEYENNSSCEQLEIGGIGWAKWNCQVPMTPSPCWPGPSSPPRKTPQASSNTC
jgi:hypothetical protein